MRIAPCTAVDAVAGFVTSFCLNIFASTAVNAVAGFVTSCCLNIFASRAVVAAVIILTINYGPGVGFGSVSASFTLDVGGRVRISDALACTAESGA
eukprot:SAG31_NODE_19857_length_590_cov_0.670061_2_plen_95_part_01